MSQDDHDHSQCDHDHHHHHIQLKPGTVLMKVPTAGASAEACLVCTGPTGCSPEHERAIASEAFIVGMMAGIVALREPRPLLCIDHETLFREILASRGIADEETLKKLGIEYEIVGAAQETTAQ